MLTKAKINNIMQLQNSCKGTEGMSKKEKMKKRIRSCPNDYTYSEAKKLLMLLGYEEYTKGKTSGSRVKFFRQKDKDIILLHKPHPSDVMVKGAVKYLLEHLISLGDL